MKKVFNVEKKYNLIKKEKGSIAIFVLIGLLFMSAFLIIMYANNANKLKILGEQYNIISEVYSGSTSDEGSYDSAYTAIRNENKKILTAATTTSTLELDKTFEEKLTNYRIYGNSVQSIYEGVQLLDFTTLGYPVSTATISTYDNGGIVEVTGKVAWAQSFNNYITVTPGETYYFSASSITGGNSPLIAIQELQEDSYYNHIRLTSSNLSSSLTIPEGMTKLRIVFCANGTATELEEDVTAVFTEFIISRTPITKWEPYTGGIETIVPDTVIQSLGYNLSRVESKTTQAYESFTSVNHKGYNGSQLISDDDYIYIGDYPVGTKFYCSQLISEGNIENQFFDHEALILYDNTKAHIKDSNMVAFDTNVGSNTKGFEQMLAPYDYIWRRRYVTGKNEYYITKTSATVKYIRLYHRTGEGVFRVSTQRIVSVEEIGDTDANIGKCRIPIQLTSSSGETKMIYIYLNAPLRKVGDVADYIDFKTQKVVRMVSVIDDTGTKSIEESLVALSTPTYEDVELPDISTFEDYTKIEVLSSLVPSKIEVEYSGYTIE